MDKLMLSTNKVTKNVLKSLICQRECLCSNQIMTRGLKPRQYDDYSINIKYNICFYDSNGKYKLRTKYKN